MQRIFLTVAAVVVAIASVGGCGGGSGGSSSAPSAASGLAGLASPGSLVFVEGAVTPSNEIKANTDALAKRIAGVDSLRGLLISELEKSAREEGTSFDFASEVEPWLGENAGAAFERLVGDELSEPLVAVETTNSKATQAFVEKLAKQSKDKSKDVSYEGVDFKVGGSEGNAVGVIGNALVIANSEREFKTAVDASKGDSLGGEDRYQQAIEAASKGSLADAYIDVGGILEQSNGSIDPQARELLRGAGIDSGEATAVASVIPHSEQVEIDLSSDLGGQKARSGDVSKLLGSLPASSLGAFAFSEFGEQLEEAVDSLDKAGVPPSVEPGELKSTLGQAGINLDKIAHSLEEGAVFVEGSNLKTLGGALVLSGTSGEATNAVASFGTLLRGAKIPGITAVSGTASGFSIRSPQLGRKPIVVLAQFFRVSIGYGRAAALAGLGGAPSATLSGTAGFKAASAALGKTPISGYIDGPAALRLAEALIPHSQSDFWNAQPYLKKLTYIGIGTGTDGELATAKLIAGVGK